MRILDLYRDFNLDFKTEGHKHCREGWVNVECPFCTGNPGYHLGFELQQEYFYCWRCGFHPVVPTLSKLLNLPVFKVKGIIKEYGGKSVLMHTIKEPDKLPFKLPTGTSELMQPHLRYLEKRGYNSLKIIEDWKIKGTGPHAILDKLNYKNRIIVPIYWNGLLVSFVARSINPKDAYRYLVCPKDREIVFHKNILYGNQRKWKRVGICVEGVTDVWRLGGNAFATFGIEFKRKQVREMVRAFDFIYVMYDNESQANVQAEKLMAELNFAGVKTKRIHAPTKDPGSMNQDDADYLVKQLMSVNFIKL